MKWKSSIFYKWNRSIHRELSFFFSGMVLIYAISGIVMNHRNKINPHFSIEKKEYILEQELPAQDLISIDLIKKILSPLDEEDHYTKHYFPNHHCMKVFLKGGSNLTVDLATNSAVYESVKRRPIIGNMAKLHYNPGKWWTVFADVFAIGLIVITITGLAMLKGKKGILGRGGIELGLGLILPLLFLLFS